MQTFSREQLPVDADWRNFRKTSITHMTRIDGPFIVETNEGPLRCEDGWLAVDARGYPYPLAAEEQALIYEEIELADEVLVGPIDTSRAESFRRAGGE